MTRVVADRQQLLLRAAEMQRLDACPGCAGRAIEAVFDDNDLSHRRDLPAALASSDYSLCLNCALLFARRRQTPAAIASHYGFFAELEHRDYAVYPPPESYRRNKAMVAREVVRIAEQRGLLSAASELLHLRSDCGSIAPVLRERRPTLRVLGADYFESNRRFAAEAHDFETIVLPAAAVAVPEGRRFDVILSNHLLTHALDPTADLAVIRGAVREGGAVLFYNENDFGETVRPHGRHWRLAPVNNYHKQLFNWPALRRLLLRSGFSVDHVERRKNTFTVVCRPAAAVIESAQAEEIAALRGDLETWSRHRAGAWRRALAVPVVRRVIKGLGSAPRPIA